MPKDVIAQLEERIKRYINTGRDPFYDEEIVDHLKHVSIPLKYLPAYKKGANNIDAIVRIVLREGLANTVSVYGMQPSNL